MGVWVLEGLGWGGAWRPPPSQNPSLFSCCFFVFFGRFVVVREKAQFSASLQGCGSFLLAKPRFANAFLLPVSSSSSLSIIHLISSLLLSLSSLVSFSLFISSLLLAFLFCFVFFLFISKCLPQTSPFLKIISLPFFASFFFLLILLLFVVLKELSSFLSKFGVATNVFTTPLYPPVFKSVRS